MPDNAESESIYRRSEVAKIDLWTDVPKAGVPGEWGSLRPVVRRIFVQALKDECRQLNCDKSKEEAVQVKYIQAVIHEAGYKIVRSACQHMYRDYYNVQNVDFTQIFNLTKHELGEGRPARWRGWQILRLVGGGGGVAAHKLDANVVIGRELSNCWGVGPLAPLAPTTRNRSFCPFELNWAGAAATAGRLPTAEERLALVRRLKVRVQDAEAQLKRLRQTVSSDQIAAGVIARQIAAGVMARGRGERRAEGIGESQTSSFIISSSPNDSPLASPHVTTGTRKTLSDLLRAKIEDDKNVGRWTECIAANAASLPSLRKDETNRNETNSCCRLIARGLQFFFQKHQPDEESTKLI